jgi:hypothetical protein
VHKSENILSSADFAAKPQCLKLKKTKLFRRQGVKNLAPAVSSVSILVSAWQRPSNQAVKSCELKNHISNAERGKFIFNLTENVIQKESPAVIPDLFTSHQGFSHYLSSLWNGLLRMAAHRRRLFPALLKSVAARAIGYARIICGFR